MTTALKSVQKFFPGVTSVVDAQRSTVIEVTSKDASSKGIKDHSHCAMAVACKRKFNLDGVIISRSVAYLVKGKKARRFFLPPSVSREIVSFDRGAGFAPGRYSLSSIPKNHGLGTRQGTQNDSGPSGTLKQARHLTTNVRDVLSGEQPED